MKNNRKISVLVSAAMAAVMLASCGGNGGSGEADVTSSAGSVQESEMSETEASIADNFFGEDYDPFADDYDPYGGNGASAAKHTPETEASAGAEENDIVSSTNETVQTKQNTHFK